MTKSKGGVSQVALFKSWDKMRNGGAARQGRGLERSRLKGAGGSNEGLFVFGLCLLYRDKIEKMYKGVELRKTDKGGRKREDP